MSTRPQGILALVAGCLKQCAAMRFLGRRQADAPERRKAEAEVENLRAKVARVEALAARGAES